MLVILYLVIAVTEISYFPDLVNGETMSHYKQLLIRLTLFDTAMFPSSAGLKLYSTSFSVARFSAFYIWYIIVSYLFHVVD